MRSQCATRQASTELVVSDGFKKYTPVTVYVRPDMSADTETKPTRPAPLCALYYDIPAGTSAHIRGHPVGAAYRPRTRGMILITDRDQIYIPGNASVKEMIAEPMSVARFVELAYAVRGIRYQGDNPYSELFVPRWERLLVGG